MNLLDDIRSDLLNQSADLSNTLRKAKVLASIMGLCEFRDWVDHELSGYPNSSRLPDYRKFTPTNLGTFSGPFQSGATNVVLPTISLPDPVKDFAETFEFFDGVAALQVQKSDEHVRRWPQELIFLARDSIKMSGGMVLADAHQPIPAHVISGILDQVKNKLLDFILGLQEENITSDDLMNRTIKPEVARNLFNINIYGDRNIVASGEDVHQTTMPVEKDNLETLVDYFRQLNVDSEDLRELEQAIAAEPKMCNGKLGPKVRAWVGGMISKAASQMWNIGMELAPKLLIDALHSFYGC